MVPPPAGVVHQRQVELKAAFRERQALDLEPDLDAPGSVPAEVAERPPGLSKQRPGRIAELDGERCRRDVLVRLDADTEDERVARGKYLARLAVGRRRDGRP